jgi:hypothetical protein
VSRRTVRRIITSGNDDHNQRNSHVGRCFGLAENFFDVAEAVMILFGKM